MRRGKLAIWHFLYLSNYSEQCFVCIPSHCCVKVGWWSCSHRKRSLVYFSELSCPKGVSREIRSEWKPVIRQLQNPEIARPVPCIAPCSN